MRPVRFSACRAEFIHGDRVPVKRTKFQPRRAVVAGDIVVVLTVALFGLPSLTRFGRRFSVASGCDAHRAQNLAERMRRHGRGLTSWNAGENFASLGIGHFIWYPAGARGPFEESFPSFVRYVEKRGAKLPELLLGRKNGACPWNSRAEFLAAESSQRMKNLRIFLTDTIDLQADFMVERLRNALPKMLAAAPA